MRAQMTLFGLFSRSKNKNKEIEKNSFDLGFISGYEQGFKKGLDLSQEITEKTIKQIKSKTIEETIKRLNNADGL